MNKLQEYEHTYGELFYNTYVIIVFGFDEDIKFYNFTKTKQDGFEEFYKIYKKYNFRNCDERGYDIKNQGKSIENAFDNDYGLMTLVGFNDADELYIWFDEDHIFISKEKNIYGKSELVIHK